MALQNDGFAGDWENRGQTEIKEQPNAYRVDDENSVEEKDLKKNMLFGKTDKPNPTEGRGTGGHKFGDDNLTPAGDDKNNPSRNAGYTNKYFARNEPSEEHPEDSNFTDKNQEGAPNYAKAQASATEPKPDKVERGNGENDRPNPQSPYREGTADDDQPNIPGPEELPDQQKVGEDDGNDHIET